MEVAALITQPDSLWVADAHIPPRRRYLRVCTCPCLVAAGTGKFGDKQCWIHQSLDSVCWRRPFRNVFVSDAAAAAVTLTSPPLWLPLVPSHFLLCLSETDSCPSAFLPLVGRLFITMDISPAPDAILIVLMKHFFFFPVTFLLDAVCLVMPPLTKECLSLLTVYCVWLWCNFSRMSRWCDSIPQVVRLIWWQAVKCRWSLFPRSLCLAFFFFFKWNWN